MTRLLQIHGWYRHDDGGETACHKCLGCESVFSLSRESAWKYCPHCGESVQIVKQDIKHKKFRDNVGVHTIVDGVWTHLKAPEFDFVVEWLNDWEQPPMWVERDSFYCKRGRHDDLKNYWPTENSRKRFGQERLRLIPSTPLPLP